MYSSDFIYIKLQVIYRLVFCITLSFFKCVHEQLELVEHIPRVLPEHAMTMGIALCMSLHNHAVKIKTKMKINTEMEIKLKIKIKKKSNKD